MREAVLSLSDDELEAIGFHGLVDAVREAGVREIELLEDRGRTCVPQVTVAEPLDVEAVSALPCVDDCELLAETDDGYRYLMELTATELPEETADDHEGLLGDCDAAVTERGILLSLVGSQDAIRDLLRDYQAAGATPDLCKLGSYEGADGPLAALTDRQREVVQTAFELGFYEVPREASTEDVAAALDVDAGTASELLQRAERNLLAEQLTA